jgi:cell division protein ZapA (FtsZ GTPase activity inhibitor)
MLNELSIKVNIANRYYPLKVNTTEQEELVRQAAKLINDKLKAYGEQFNVKDQQDMLSMTVLEITTQLMTLQKQQAEEQQHLAAELQEVQALLK